MNTLIRKLCITLFSLCAFNIAFAEGLSANDYMEIEQLYAKYNWAIDSGDGEAYAATFVDDGVFNSFTGHAALSAFVTQWQEKMGGANRKHWNSNLRIEGDGKTAKGSVYLLLVDISTKPVSIIASASYSDELVKTSEGWRFSKRATKSDAPAK